MKYEEENEEKGDEIKYRLETDEKGRSEEA